MFSRGGVTLSVPFPFIQSDKARPVALDMEVLYPFSAGLIWRNHIKHQLH